ncbi:MAG: MerR family transcriptional regulator, partial [Chitinophagaceae bacterium]
MPLMHYFRCVMVDVAANLVNPFQYSADDVIELLRENPDGLLSLFTQFSTRYLHIGQLGIERNTLINWEKGGLIPYTREEKGWRKFSFLEAVWIKTLEEMRALGVSTDTIRIVKEALWAEGQDSFYNLILANVQPASKNLSLGEDALKQLQGVTPEQLKREMAELQLSPLMFCMVVSLLQKITYLLAVNKHQEILLVPLVNAASPDAHESVTRLHADLFATSCTVINLRSILKDLAFHSEVELSEEVLFSVLSPTEQRIIEAAREKQYQEILIQKDGEGEPTHIKVTKRGVDQALIKKLHAFLKKGEYGSIQFKTRDGQLIQFEQTSVIKLE